MSCSGAALLEFVEQAGELFRGVFLAEFGNLGACKFVATLVVRMSGVALDPVPLDFVASAKFIECAPEVLVLDRFPVCGSPVARFPGCDPGGDAVPQVFRVGKQLDLARFLDRA